MAEESIYYLWFPISEASGSLRMTNGHPYGEIDLFRVWLGCIGWVAGRRERRSLQLDSSASRLDDIYRKDSCIADVHIKFKKN